MGCSFKSEDITFPCTWHGSLVMMSSAEGVEPSVERIFAELGLADHEVRTGNVSRGGRYATWKLRSVVPDLATLRELFSRLEALPGVRMLI